MAAWALLAGVVAAGVLTVALARASLFVVKVDGSSMVPTFRAGEAVLAVRRMWWRRPLRRGEIVVCRLSPAVPGPPGLLIKRVAGVAGDRLAGVAGDRIDGADGVVPPGRVFVCGDGPGSYDSRQFGPIPVTDVLGHVVARLSVGRDRDRMRDPST